MHVKGVSVIYTSTRLEVPTVDYFAAPTGLPSITILTDAHLDNDPFFM